MSNQAPTLIRRPTRQQFSNVVQVLDYLNVAYNKPRGVSRGRREGFWQRHSEAELEWIFKDAKTAYAAVVKAIHPDKGGSHDMMAPINAGWDLLKRQFEIRCRGLAKPPAEPTAADVEDFREAGLRRSAEYRAKHPRVKTPISGTPKARERAAKASHARWIGHSYVTHEEQLQKRRLRYRNRRAALQQTAK